MGYWAIGGKQPPLIRDEFSSKGVGGGNKPPTGQKPADKAHNGNNHQGDSGWYTEWQKPINGPTRR
jgi:hypothetical protein